jgi:hypothetical protein
MGHHLLRWRGLHAFTSSSTFGPTDTLVMARRAKVLMMLSLIIFGGLVARAVGKLQ